MRRVQSNLLQIFVAVWAAALLTILLIHRVAPKDPWATMLSRPAFLLLASLLVACIPLLAAKSAFEKRSTDEDGDLLSDSSQTQTGIRSDTYQKMALVWLTSVVIFGAPHGTTAMGSLDFIWHNPLFLIAGPLALGCIPLLSRSFASRGRNLSIRPITDSSPYLLWKGLISSLIMAIVLILCLIGVNSMKGAVGKLSVNIALSVLLAGDLWALRSVVIKLRNRRADLR